MNFIKRERYIDLVKPFLGVSLIKVLTGQRRVGKSYLLYQLIELIKQLDPNANIIYINKELYEFDFIKDYKSLNSYFEDNRQTDQNNYFFIDEIQEIDEFEKCLRSIQAKKEAEIFITGSNAQLLSGELSTFLSGRYVEIKVFGLSYREFLHFRNLKKGTKSFNDYIKFGGLPGLVHFQLEERAVYDYLRNIYSAILFKDVVKRHNIRNVAFLENLIQFLADHVGSIVSAKKVSDFLKSQKVNLSPSVVINYLDFLKDAFFLFKVQRWDLVGKKVFEIGEKYYFEDLGLRHSVVGFRQSDINKILENIVFIHLKVAGYDVRIGWENGREIDFICEKNGEKLYIQVAYLIATDEVRDREFGNLLRVNDNYPKIVLSMDDFTDGTYLGIKQENIIDFIYKLA
ncbi:ATP-binding protein [Dyadobacter sp. CY327]|uniref:ATP-binding protein n=1 Tax=Dyadobacter sp. CY327 TaxID=2907301 RepID=UPI001F3E4A0F|nr:ATP-binding protein [Dyadobacter sp. CY327]MCE7069588.1 ATP-binding protein [Dyadobacter sp. CY327]